MVAAAPPAQLTAARRTLAVVGLLAGCACLVLGIVIMHGAGTSRLRASQFSTGPSGLASTTTTASTLMVGGQAPGQPAPIVVPVTATQPPPAPAAGADVADPANTAAPGAFAPSTATAPVDVGIAPPASIVIPAQHVSALVEPVGVLGSGELQVPDDPLVVGWWVGSAAPGASNGNVVIAGHVDSRRYGIGTFKSLLRVRAGDEVDVIDTSGQVHRYTVVGRQQTDKHELPADLFDPAAPPGLVLVTCGGTFNESTRHYDDNIIVLAQPMT